MFAFQIGLDGLSVNGKAERVVTAYVAGNFFSALGIQPVLGRFLRPGEGEVAGTGPGIVLGYQFWQRRFGGSGDVIGQKVLLDGHPITILGVAPNGFRGLFPLADMQAYIPVGLAGLEGLPAGFLDTRSFRNLSVYARLRPGQSLAQAQALLNTVASRLAHDYAENQKERTFEVFPELRSRPNPDSDGTILMISLLFLGLAGMVLLLACVNVANFLLVRATVRQREMAIRVALGAARSTLLRQLLTESVLLGFCGGMLGILLGISVSTSLSGISVGTDLPVYLDFGFDWRVFGYAFGGALLSGLIVGVVPALRASRANVNEILQQGGRGSVGGRHRLRNVLVSAQVAASLTLLIVAGLFTRSLTEAQRINLGFNPSHLANFDMDPSEIGYSDAQGQNFYRSVLERVRSLPAVQSASLAGSVPMGYIGASDTLSIPGKDTKNSVSYNVVSGDYFDTLGIKILKGRAITAADTPTSAFTAVISQQMAKELWPDQDPIGREFHMALDPSHSLRIVGVAGDVHRAARSKVRPFFYIPLAQHYSNNSFETLQVRTAGDPHGVMAEVEQTIHSLAPDLPVFDVRTMTEALYTLNGLLVFQLGAGLAGALGLLGLALALIGVYGVISYAATQQTHEIGLRMALGAKPINVLQMMFARGLLIIGSGLAVGLFLTFAAADFIGKFVVVSPTDPATYSAVTALLMFVALLACYVPARRAMRVDPMVALRYD